MTCPTPRLAALLLLAPNLLLAPLLPAGCNPHRTPTGAPRPPRAAVNLAATDASREVARAIRESRPPIAAPPELANPLAMLRRPTTAYPQSLTRAYYFALEDPETRADGVRALVEGAATDHATDAVFARQIDLIAWTFRPATARLAEADPPTRDVAALLDAWPEPARVELAWGLLAAARPALVRKALDRLRDGRLAPETAARFGLAHGPEARPADSLLLVAAVAGASEAVAYWARSGLVDDDPDAFRAAFAGLEAEDLPAADLAPFFRALPGMHPARSREVAARLRAARDARLDTLARLPGAAGRDRAWLCSIAGLGGPAADSDDDVARDLARLTDARARRSVERMLSVAAPARAGTLPPRPHAFGR